MKAVRGALRVRLAGEGGLDRAPYHRAELECRGLRSALADALRREAGASVWLTDQPQAAEALAEAGRCVVYVLTPRNQGAGWPGTEWCAERPDREFLWRVWLRKQGLPWHICETQRLCLRETVEEDLDCFYEMMEDADSARFLAPLEENRQKEKEKLLAYRQQMYGFYGFGIWTVLEKSTGRVVGRAGLQMREGGTEPELGFGILSRERGQGYGEEACRAVLHYAREELELPFVRAMVEEENVKSRRLCEKLGFSVDNMEETEGRRWIIYHNSSAMQK